eukprot:8557855-Alexandrium_andersonii.AAC.1
MDECVARARRHSVVRGHMVSVSDVAIASSASAFDCGPCDNPGHDHPQWRAAIPTSAAPQTQARNT